MEKRRAVKVDFIVEASIEVQTYGKTKKDVMKFICSRRTPTYILFLFLKLRIIIRHSSHIQPHPKQMQHRSYAIAMPYFGVTACQ